MPTQRGFTLIELMVTVSLLAILLSVAIPSFRDMLQNNRTQTIADNLMTALQYARSEAIKRGAKVEICRSANTSDATPICANSTAWGDGWLVKVSGGAVLRVWEPVSSANQIAGPNETLTFLANGLRSNSGDKSFTVKFSNCSGKPQYTITVAATGRATKAKGTCP